MRAAVAYGHLDGAVVDLPGDLQAGAGQWLGVPDGVTEQFADYEGCVAHRLMHDAGGDKIGGQPLPRYWDAPRCIWNEYGTRCPHLPA